MLVRSVVLLVFLVVSVSAVRTVAAPADDVARIFANHCVDCHSLAKGRTEKNLDLTDLVAVGQSRRLIDPEKHEESKLYDLVREGDMPPQDGDPKKPPLTAAQKTTLLNWIKAGAPPPAGVVDTSGRFIPNRTVIKELFQDLLEIDEHDRPFIRYLTLTVEYNSGDTDATLEQYRKGVRKLLNSLSWKPRLATVTSVGTGKTLLRFDLRDLGWTQEKWDYLVQRYPYAVEFDGADARMLTSAGGSPVVHLRADWFAFAATQPAHYHFLLDLPDNILALEQSLGVDAAANIRNFRVARGAIGPKRSGVPDHNRLVERHDIDRYPGAYWKSYDFSASTGAQDLLNRPLGPGRGPSEFAHDGGEMIFNLPNGLQAYLLTTADGKRIDKGPPEIVNDRTALAGTEIVNGLSCIKCHANGMLPVADEVRSRLDVSPGSYPADLHRAITRLYPGNKKLTEFIVGDRMRFQQALKAIDADHGDNPEPITQLVRRFVRPLTIATAHAEVGLPTVEFKQRLAQSAALAGIRHDLERTNVARENFIASFRTIVTELRLGKPRDAGVPPPQLPPQSPPQPTEKQTSDNAMRRGTSVSVEPPVAASDAFTNSKPPLFGPVRHSVDRRRAENDLQRKLSVRVIFAAEWKKIFGPEGIRAIEGILRFANANLASTKFARRASGENYKVYVHNTTEESWLPIELNDAAMSLSACDLASVGGGFVVEKDFVYGRNEILPGLRSRILGATKRRFEARRHAWWRRRSSWADIAAGIFSWYQFSREGNSAGLRRAYVRWPFDPRRRNQSKRTTG